MSPRRGGGGEEERGGGGKAEIKENLNLGEGVKISVFNHLWRFHDTAGVQRD